ncbi:MAG: hypothetical protein GF329_05995 [Candidatus Lokiarchaeota archaeon]|nr:hypothetical protein [Candidatus Lokiarchaeota archaeon]
MDNLKRFLKKSYGVEIDSEELIILSSSILNDLENNKEICIKLFEWVRDKIKYKLVRVIGALGTYKRKSGACIDKSSLLIALLRINKIPSRYITLKANLIAKQPISERYVNHCAVQAYINNRWVILDPTFDPSFDKTFPKAQFDKPGWWDMKDSLIHQERFEISKLEMDITSRSYERSTPWKKMIENIKSHK